MFGLIITLGGIWALFFFLLAPDWLLLLAFAPLGLYSLHYVSAPYQAWIILLFLPILVLDIETLEDGINFKGIWSYIAWLPVLFLLAIVGYQYQWSGFRASFGNIWDVVISILVIVLVGKLWISTPLMLFINRLNITQTDEATYHLKELQAKRSGRAVSYYLVANNLAKLEISGITYLYLKVKKAGPNDEITFRFKTGWLGITFARGFPRVGIRAN